MTTIGIGGHSNGYSNGRYGNGRYGNNRHSNRRSNGRSNGHGGGGGGGGKRASNGDSRYGRFRWRGMTLRDPSSSWEPQPTSEFYSVPDVEHVIMKLKSPSPSPALVPRSEK